MDYSVIILGYRRPAELVECVAAVRAQRPPPAEIIVWHNSPSRPIVGVTNIVADRNFGCAARHAAGLLAAHDRLVFVDDDVRLGPRAIEAMLEVAAAHPRQVIGARGRLLAGPESTYAMSPDVRDGGPATIVKGWLHSVDRRLLAEVWRHDPPEMAQGEDDICLCAAIGMATGLPPIVAGLAPGHVQLRDDGRGLSSRPDHFQRRQAAIGWWVAHGWRPYYAANNQAN